MDLDDKMANVQELCLICSEICTRIKEQPHSNTFHILPGAEGNTSINSQLWSLFVLQKVLQYPNENIIGLLKDTYGIPLSDWFVLCTDCSSIAKNAMAIYQKLLKLENEYVALQVKFRRKIYNSYLKDIQANNNIDRMDNVFCVKTKIRKHFSIDSNIDSPLKSQEFKREQETDNWGQAQSSEFQEYDDDDNNFTQSFSSKNEESNLNEDPYEQKDNKFYCKICTCRRLYTTRDSILKHLWRHRNHKYPCVKCKFPCETEKALKIHLKRDLCTESNELKCEQCNFVTVLKIDLEKHRLETHHLSVEPLKADPKKHGKRIGLPFKKQGNSKSVKVAKPRKDFNCIVCSFKTMKRQTLNLHLKRHEYFENLEKIGDKLKCKLCDNLFPTRLYLMRHVRQLHGNEIGMSSFTCTDCDLNFGDLSSLNSHIACVHTKQCTYFCDKCGMGFVSRSIMERHILTHDTTNKSFIRDLCGAQLKSNASLKMHIKKVHKLNSNSSKMFTCKFCINSDTFLNKSILNRQIRTKHENLYIYKCEDCDSSYLSQSSLQTHKKVKHENGAPVQCQFCQKKFLNKVYLNAHYLKYCPKKPVDFMNELTK